MGDKMIRYLSILAIISVILAACGKEETAIHSAKPNNVEPVTLTFWSALNPSSEQGKTIQRKVKEFDDSHDHINVELQVISYDVLYNKLVTSFNAGDMPDLSWGLSEWIGEFNRYGVLADLTPYMAKWPDKENIYPNVLEALTIDGKLKALPNYIGIRALLYHDDILVQAGVTSPPRTWDELLDAAHVVKEKTGKEIMGIAGSGVRAPQELIMYLAQNGLQIAELQVDGKYRNTWNEDPEKLAKATEVFQFYQDLIDSGAVHEDAKTWGWEEEDQNFVFGQYAMAINGPWIEGRVPENPDGMKDVNIAEPFYNKVPATFMEIAPLFVYRSEHPDEAFELASFLVGADYQKAVNPANPPRTDIETEGWGKAFMDHIPKGIVFPNVSLGGITKAMEDSLALALLKKEDPEEVARLLSNEVNKSLESTDELSRN